MAQQALARDLLSAATIIDPKATDTKYQLVVDSSESSLSLQTWNGENLEQEELVAGAVRPGSTAALLLLPTGKLVIAISPSSKLAAYTYDEDESEWSESKDHPVSKYTVHPKGKLTSITSPSSGRTLLFFQDETGGLVYLNTDWKLTAAQTVDPLIPGSPILVSGNDAAVHVFYVSSKDNFIHVVSRDSTKWTDVVAVKYAFDRDMKSFVFGDKEAYVLTGKNGVISVSVEGEKKVLGKIEEGKFVSGTTEENMQQMSWNGGGYQEISSPDGAMWQWTQPDGTGIQESYYKGGSAAQIVPAGTQRQMAVPGMQQQMGPYGMQQMGPGEMQQMGQYGMQQMGLYGSQQMWWS